MVGTSICQAKAVIEEGKHGLLRDEWGRWIAAFPLVMPVTYIPLQSRVVPTIFQPMFLVIWKGGTTRSEGTSRKGQFLLSPIVSPTDTTHYVSFLPPSSGDLVVSSAVSSRVLCGQRLLPF